MKTNSQEIYTIPFEDPRYPELLRHIPTPPSLLYIRGDLEYNQEYSLAVVGTRRPSSYGKEVTEPLVDELVRYGFTIISGLAIGIDALSHSAALNAHGKTIAVLGSGVDEKSIYPPQNRNLAKRILENGGGIISEFPPGIEPLPHHFLQRNRIISGLARGVLIIEAPERSGALNTANHALEQGREVFAIPGPIFSKNSRGTNTLIKMGARLVTSADDIIEELGLTSPSPSSTSRQASSPEEEQILTLLEDAVSGLDIETIIQQSRLNPKDISSILTIMELTGKIKNIGHNCYAIKR